MVQRCPVPVEQQPLNQYEDVRDSWFYSWGHRPWGAYLRPLLWLWLMSWVVTGPMAAASFSPSRYPLAFSLGAGLGALILPTLALLQLYVGWAHVAGRLGQPTVPYEESGWYDGQLWVKPEEICQRDRLIVDYQVKPVLRRLRWTLLGIGGLVATGLISWSLI